MRPLIFRYHPKAYLVRSDTYDKSYHWHRESSLYAGGDGLPVNRERYSHLIGGLVWSIGFNLERKVPMTFRGEVFKIYERLR